jgi:hypothetical protein
MLALDMRVLLLAAIHAARAPRRLEEGGRCLCVAARG